MKRRWIGGLAGLLLAFILGGCGATGQVESLSPEEMESYIKDKEKAYILLNNTEDKEERKANIELVEKTIESINVMEINAKSEDMLDNGLKPKDLGLKDIQFGTLGIYKDGTLEEYVSLRNADHPTEDEKEKALQQFIDNINS
ncbi:hypothetical protein [Halobacillus amylolyticus]|uniref:Lipoprotein n=1 Tax=Halobacillus amylolyticus TaxID=2932259 RepID=A0ABY4HAU1_9BACI|nr:hypothetical protein [Halobacillus amylolyticus]UOR12011.1 hypothetical protein MUO15_00240 [Halobacillus amylolyticus]